MLTFLVLPFVAFSIPEEHFDALRQQSLSGEQDVVEHVGGFHPIALRIETLTIRRGRLRDADSILI